jgi:branched-chain amino acid transport system substrate-binding protein
MFGAIVPVLLSMTLYGCEKSATTSQDSSGDLVVRIGASAPLTGPQAHLGKDNENGTRMAIDDANAKGIVIGGRRRRPSWPRNWWTTRSTASSVT